jgi:hypothetical protein
MKNRMTTPRIKGIAASVVFSMLFVQGLAAASGYPKYRLSPTAPRISDSVTFFLAKGTHPNSCIPSYTTSFAIKQIPIFCKSTRAPCPAMYRITISYDSVSRTIDSLVGLTGIESAWRYIYNNDTVYYVVSECCDGFNFLYAKNGARLCAPDGGYSGRGDGKCPDFFEKATNKTPVSGFSPTGGVACLQVLTDYGPLFRFGKLAAGGYQVYDARDSVNRLLQFTVSAASTAVKPDADRAAVGRGAGDLSLRLHEGSLAFLLEKPQRLAIAAFRPDGRLVVRIGRRPFSEGAHRVFLGPLALQGLLILRVDGEGWSRVESVHGAQGLY